MLSDLFGEACMKKLFVFITLAILCASMLLAQQSRIDGENTAMTFRAYMEKNLAQEPENIVRWYRGKTFDESVGVSEYEFLFYRSVADFYTYAHAHDGNSKLFNAKKTFKYVAESNIMNDIHHYKIRSYLFLGASFLLRDSEHEIAAQIYQYVYNTLDRQNKYYYSSIYWLLHSEYIEPTLYASLYDILAAADDRAPVYDFLKVRPSTKKSMITKLTKPSKYKQKYYTWTSGISVDALVEDNLYRLAYDNVVSDEFVLNTEPTVATTTEPIMIEDDRLITTEIGALDETMLAPEPNIEDNNNMLTPEPASSNLHEVEQPLTVPTTDDDDSLISRDTVVVVVDSPSDTIYQVATAAVYIDIISDSSLPYYMNAKIGDENIIFSSDSTVSKKVMLPIGEQPVEIQMGDKLYKYSIDVTDNNNIYTIVIGEKNKRHTLYAPAKEAILAIGQNAALANDVEDRAKDSQSAWFDSNPYSSWLGMDENRYRYLRGVALYNDYISGVDVSAIVLARAAEDFESVILANEGDKISASMYLAFVNLLQNGSNGDSDNRVARAIMFSDEEAEYLYPSMLYWRMRFEYMSYDQEAMYKQRLAELDPNTPIIDYTTGAIITLGEAQGLEERSIVSSIFENQIVQARTPAEVVPNISAKMNLINMSKDSTSVVFANTWDNIRMGFMGKIYHGANLIEVADNNTSLALMIDTALDSNYIFTFLAY